MKLQKILKEVEDKVEVDALDRAMGAAFQAMGAEFKNKEGEIKQDVSQSDAQINESLGAVAIIGFILALPKLIEVFTKSIGGLVNTFKKFFKPGAAKNDQEGTAAKIIEITRKWHKAYIKGVKWILKVSGVFKKAGITDDEAQMKAAEVVYYTIVAGLAVYSGIGSITAFKSAIAAKGTSGTVGFSLSAFEAAMATIKTTEVRDFLLKMGLK